MCRCKQLFVLLLTTCVFSVTRALEAEPLLACVTAGMLLANRRCEQRKGSKHEGSMLAAGMACVCATTMPLLLLLRRLPGSDLSQEELAGLINSIMAITNVAFFGLAGASLKLVCNAGAACTAQHCSIAAEHAGGCKWRSKLSALHHCCSAPASARVPSRTACGWRCWCFSCGWLPSWPAAGRVAGPAASSQRRSSACFG